MQRKGEDGKKERLKTKKETWERGLSCALGQRISLYLYLYQIYYKSLYGCRQVAEPSKIIGVVFVCFESILALFYHPNSLQWTEIPRFHLRFYNCYILCSFNWRRLWEIALQVLALWCLSSSKSSRMKWVYYRDSTKSNRWYFCSFR